MMTKTRLEAFSDGVLAIIITIMVLGLRAPDGHEWASLLALWPVALSYVLSFVFVGIYWNNHHHLLYTVHRVNGGILWANLHLLFWLSLLPFTTSWLGESHFEAIPMTCYAADALMCAVAYSVLVQTIIRADVSNHVLLDAIGSDGKGRLSVVAYALAVVTPFFGAGGVVIAGLLLIGVALMWLIPDRRIEAALARERTA